MIVNSIKLRELSQIFGRNWIVRMLFLMFVIGSFLMGCGKDSHIDAAEEPDSFVRFAQNEIDWLQKVQPGITKTVTAGEKVETESLDSLDWNNELEAIRTWSVFALAKNQRRSPLMTPRLMNRGVENCKNECQGYGGRVAGVNGDVSQRGN